MEPVTQENEIWRPVVGYEGWYAISNTGRVMRIAGGRGVGRPLLKPYAMKIGYYSVIVSLGSAATRRHRYVHELVAAAFIGPRPYRHQINHIDGDKINNRVENLEYVTQAENIRHARRIGLAASGERSGGAKLTADQVREMCQLRPSMTLRSLAKMFGVSSPQVHRITSGQRWKHLTSS